VSVRTFAEKFLREEESIRDILVLNAGIVASSAERSVDGFDPIFATNHMGHQLPYQILEDRIQKTAELNEDARMVVESSFFDFRSYDDGVALSNEELNRRWDVQFQNPTRGRAYEQSKLANVLFAKEASLRNRNQNVFVNVAHPGVVSSKLLGR